MLEQHKISGTNAAEIIAAIEAGIRNDQLPAGHTLPSVRGLATQLGVANGTVAAAYRTLRQRGYIDTNGRHGSQVRQRSPLRHRTRPLPLGVQDLSNGAPDPSLLPNLADILPRIPTVPAGYPDAGHCPDLLDQARHRLGQDNITGSISVTGGALAGIERALTSRLIPGDTIAIEDPAWACLKDLIAALGMNTIPIPVDQFGPTPDGLAAALDRGAHAVVITSRAQNPTGVSISATRAEQLRHTVARAEALIIEDDHWAELADNALHVIANAAPHWLFIRSTSKPYGPDLRLAIIAGDEATVTSIDGSTRIGPGWTSTILQHIVLELWTDPGVANLIKHARDTYRHRYTALLNELNDHNIEPSTHTGLNMWIPVPDETHAATTMRDYGYAIAPGSAYRLDSAPGMRLTISTIDPTEAPKLAEAIHSARTPPTRGI